MIPRYRQLAAVEEERMLPGGRSCMGCGGGIITRTVLKAIGPNVIASTGSCGTNTTGMYPIGPMGRLPMPVSILGGGGGILSGIEEVLRVQGRTDVTVLGMMGDGDVADIGFGGVSGLFERGHKVIIVCMDNQAYAATGGQRSGTTPLKARTRSTPHGKESYPKDLPFIFLAHGLPYVATASAAHPEDLYRKVLKAKLRENQPAYIHALMPCPPAWGNEPRKTVEVGRLAVESGLWPLWELERGVFRRTRVARKKPVEAYLGLQRRFADLTDEDIREVKAYVEHLERKVRACEALYATRPAAAKESVPSGD